MLTGLLLALTSSPVLADQAPAEAPPVGLWRAWLDSPGGELPFHLEFRPRRGDHELRVAVLNGVESIPIPEVRWHDADDGKGAELILRFTHYDSEIRARPSLEGSRLDGTWRKRRGLDDWTEMEFHAVAGVEQRFRETPIPLGAPDLPALAERYRVDFSSAKDDAVGLFQQSEQGLVTGTFLTTLGDYRYLAGRRNGNRLLLSCFDGAHAFLFDARLLPAPNNGTPGPPRLEGEFWSSDRWHEKWTAHADPEATLPDPLAEVELAVPAAEIPALLAGLRYPDLDGNEQSVLNLQRSGRPLLITLFGSWCPNCNDETRYLVELHQRYTNRDIQIIGLAFEVTGDRDRDLQQLRKYAQYHQIPYPILLAGSADKQKAAAAFPALKAIKSYPTLILLDRHNQVDAIWSGFSGPATGAAHQRLRQFVEARLDKLLLDPTR